MHSLPDDLRNFVKRVSSTGHEVWLIGSRANGTARTNSDWDVLIFGNKALLDALAMEEPLDNVDILVVHDGDAFQSPWNKTKEGVLKSGSLSGWEWQPKSETEATYSGTKWPNDWGSTRQATRISP
jgi:predicted nucleotidyltransferase